MDGFFILLIPMINLSGMVGSRMEARMGEFGVRKSFGAWRGDVLQQITGENLLLTLLGGVLGLVLSYVLLGVFSEQFNGMVPGEAMAMAFSMEKVEGGGILRQGFLQAQAVCAAAGHSAGAQYRLGADTGLQGHPPAHHGFVELCKVIGLCLNRYSNNSGSTAAAMRGSSWR